MPDRLLYHQMHLFHSCGVDIHGQFDEFLLGLKIKLTVFTGKIWHSHTQILQVVTTKASLIHQYLDVLNISINLL